MFTFLGKSVAKRPLVYVILWCVLLVLGFTAALSGFGQGNLFQRIESSSSLVPGSESDIVAKKTSSEESGEKITAIIQGVSLQESKNALLELNQQIAEIENVAQVLDPIKIDEKFKAELAKEEEKALQETINNAQPQITAAITQTLAAQKHSCNFFQARCESKLKLRSKQKYELKSLRKSRLK
ncbi:hypothetical protein [Arcanobacterium hippocoleae]|uniref:hypothetical protein n=1 Tax=Arcanobacterium hippocoleae TaxID=149017 RepID=UPI00333F1795